MGPVSNAMVSMLRSAYLLKVRLLANLLGIEYVSGQLSTCDRGSIAPLLKTFGASIGDNVNFKDTIWIDNATGDQDATNDFSNLVIGNNCYIGKGVYFDLPDKIVIESECAVSAGAMFITHEDCGRRPMSRWYPRKRGGITVGSGSWIGANAILLSDTSLGQCCVVAAGSVVKGRFGEFSVIAGSPARLVKTLPRI